jgi:anaerobic selenocysteine-containing dehydrogenase
VSQTTTMRIEPSYCRFCPNGCPILVEVDPADGRAVSVTGDDSNDVYQGYTCVKGRALPEQHNHPERLLHSQRRRPDGTYEPISSTEVMDEIAARLREIIDQHGPQSVAFYFGTMVIGSQLIVNSVMAFVAALGTPFMFNPNTIDQPGKDLAKALHGNWSSTHDFGDPEVLVFIGTNPMASYLGGFPYGHPGKWLQRWTQKGCKLIVIDPRRTDIAKRADLFLQPRPGEDAAILAALLKVVIDEELYDLEFVEDNVDGVEALRDVVAPFTPEYVAERAGVDADDLVATARLLATAGSGFVFAGTGPNMSGPGTLVEYLIRNLNTMCGRWSRAGDVVRAPGVLVPPAMTKAQPIAPWKAYDLMGPLPGTDRFAGVAGLPMVTLTESILSDAEPRIRALVSLNGNPAAAIPDQIKVVEALEALELLVQVDIKMSATAQLADYVVAPTMQLEVPACSSMNDGLSRSFVGIGNGGPWGHYTKAVATPPPGSDVVEEWEFLYGLAQRLGLELSFAHLGTDLPPTPIDMVVKPTTDELLDIITAGSRVPLDEVKEHPHGAMFPEPTVVVEPKDPDCTARFDVANVEMMRDLAEIARQPAHEPDPVLPDGTPLDLRLVSRRIQQAINSSGRSLKGLRKRPYNPAFLHPDDMARLGLQAEDLVEIRSARAAVVGIAQPDDTVRPGVLSMTHGFGDLPGRDDARRKGASTSRLLRLDEGLQPYTSQPRMSNVPVAVRRLDAEDAT